MKLPFFRRDGQGALPKIIGPADPILTAAIVALVAFGVVMVFSASAVFADQRYDDAFFFLKRQSIFATVGIVGMLAAARFDYHRFRPLTYPILGVSVVLLLVIVLGFGRQAGGAARWIPIGPFNIQPTEMAKLAVILWLSYSLSKKAETIRSFQVGFLPHMLVAGLLMALCLKQPDFGSAVMIGMLTFTLLFAAGARLGYLIGAALVALPVAFLFVRLSAYRMRRIEAFLEPFEHRYDIGYQIVESLLSFGAGGITGVGIGDSRQKLLFLPEAHTDFISAIVGEELGFVGMALLFVIYGIITWRALRIAANACDDYGTYVATGIGVFVGLQAFTNLAVAMGLLPTKGLVLPFISYGGSSLLVNLAAVGILLNVSRPRDVEEVAEDEIEIAAAEGETAAVSPRRGRRRNRRSEAAPLADGLAGGRA